MNYWLIYVSALVIIFVLYLRRHRKITQADAAELRTTQESGLAEPPSLHPLIDPSRCIGSGSCAVVCPEEALGLVDGKAVLKNASACIGHGACQAACPFDAISLVFGTEKRGIDIPQISPEFETNIPGIFIAGELGGMGLIRKAAEQGRQAMDSVRKRKSGAADFDVVIVGCGPAGLSAGLSAIRHRLKYKLIEQEDSLGGAVYQYPRHKIAMTSPVELDIVGKVKFGEIQKEKLLDFWQNIVSRTGLQVHFRERMETITPKGSIFEVKTSQGTCTARSVLLAMGRRGTPRKLEVEGENLPKVTYRLVDPEQYRGQSVLVVGGGDSALEAAIALSEQTGTRVSLSYRSEAFSRVKQKNRQRLEAQQAAGRINVLLGSRVIAIQPSSVEMEYQGERTKHPNDAVIICAGGLLPMPQLQNMGIHFSTKFGTV